MSQLLGKYLADNAADGRVFRLANSQHARARNAANTGDISMYMVDANDHLKFLTQPKADDALAMPSAAKDYITVEWAENFFNGKQDPKEAVDALSDAQVALTGTAPLMVDGYSFVNNDSIGLIGQTDPVENGPYLYTVNAGNYTLTRRDDFNQDSEVSKGAYFPVIGGTFYAGYIVILTTENPIVLGTTELDFVAYPSALSIIAGDGLVKNGNTISINLAALSGLESTNPGMVGGQLRVKTDTEVLEKDKTTRRDPVSGAVVAKRRRHFFAVLSPTDITNQYLDLSHVAGQNSVMFQPQGAPMQTPDVDFEVIYTGGAGSNTRVGFLGGLATGGASALVSSERVDIYYDSF